MKFTKKLLTSLSADEKRAVVAMIILLFREEKKSNPCSIVGDYAAKLVMWHCSDEYKQEICEQLVKKGIFLRQSGEEAVSMTYSQQKSDDNWYSFNSDFVEFLDRSDNKRQEYYEVIGDWIAELEHAEAMEMRRTFYTEAARGMLQATYL
ncbi:MAG: hypothetical protein WA584_23630 [Pyrinomonadaceae bacterium]